MSERYSKLFSLPENLYAAGSPVVIAAGALLKDNQTGKVIAQLKIRNIQDWRIKAATVCITPLDTVGNPLGETVRYQYLDLNAGRNEEFGQKAAIALPDASTRSFAVCVNEVVFVQNTIWTETGACWEKLRVPKSLQSLGNSELIKQFRIEYGNDCKNLLLEEKDLWHCVCGGLNHTNENQCHHCRKSLSELRAIDLDKLQAERDARVAAEKEQAEKEAAAAKKKGKIAAIVVPILIIVIVAAVLISGSVKKKNTYEMALSLMESEKYEDAIEHFATLGDYKDSVEQIQIAEAKIEEKANYARMEDAYIRAKLLLETGSDESENEAYSILMELGDYKDTKALLECFKYVCLASDNIRYKYDSSGNLIETDYGSSSCYYEYENGHIIWEGTSKSDWGATTYTYYADGTLKSTIDGVSRNSSGVVTTQTVYYNEDGYPETVVYERDDNPNKHEAWKLAYTISDSGSITSVICSVQGYGETEAITKSFDFGDHDGFVSIEIATVDSYLVSPVRLTLTNANKTYTEKCWITYSAVFNKNISMRKDCEITTEYDSSGKIASETTFYPTTKGKITKNYSYDNQGNVIEARSNAKENTDGKLYITTYTYGYIYCPDAE